MRIGILQTDELDSAIKNEYVSYADMFQRLFLVVDDQLEFNVYQVLDEHYPEHIDECDAYLITGSKASAHGDELWIIKLRDYIVRLHDQRKKLVGICFGHQLVARALGGITKKSEHGWGVGNVTSLINQIKPWNSDETKQFSLLASHQDQVTKLPDQAELIAGNDFCPIASYQVDSHILTFQGHPEFTEDYLKYSMNKRRNLIGEEKYNTALVSLDQPHDGQLVAHWMIDFIKLE